MSPTQFLLHVEICFYLHTTTSHHQPPASLCTHRGQGLHCSSPGIMSTDFTSHDRHTPGRCHAPCHDDESPRVTNVSIPHLIVLHICTLYTVQCRTVHHSCTVQCSRSRLTLTLFCIVPCIFRCDIHLGRSRSQGSAKYIKF